MSIIEQATRRLEQLRRSGVEIPWHAADGQGGAARAVNARTASPRESDAAEASRPGLHAVPNPAAEAEVVARVPGSSKPGSQSKLVQIDLARLVDMGYLTPMTPRAQIANEFRVIKRPLLSNIDAKPADGQKNRNSLVMVTSSVPDEGKTFVSVNLAISLAMELDRSVLLVDADVSRPSVLSRLGLKDSPGLLDVLAGPDVGLSDVLLRTNIERLTILPAGAPRGQATEMLASDGMIRLLAEMSARYPDRVIVFDTPPLLPSPESRVLAAQMGQVVLVVAADQTPQRLVQQALNTLEACPVVMSVLNKASRSDVGFYYGNYGPDAD